MTDDSRLSVPWPLAVTVAAGLLALGALGATWFARDGQALSTDAGSAAGMTQAGTAPAAGAAAPMAMGATPSGTEGPTVTLTPELVRRAGITLAEAETAALETSLRLPGQVEPNAYRSVAVTPLVAGRVTHVAAELGDRVGAGDMMARVYSPELAQAQAAFLSSQAALAAHDLQLARTERLIEIGAASGQELEHVHAEHAAMSTQVASARSTLELLGLSAVQIERLESTSEISAVVDVPAPLGGIVTERRANVGLNVDTAMALFTVIDLSAVWVVADLYERDFAAVRVGSRATVTATAYPDLAVDGQVSYIDPRVRPDTRTARVRVEIPNPGGRLRLGMYVDVSLHVDSTEPGVVVPVAALQLLGDRIVVYVPGTEEGTFVEREVRQGRRSGDRVEITSGLTAGERVVTDGAFFLRAERARVSPTAHQH